ncbi:single-stranded DNA-binding protein [Cellulosilyticum sp. WCF-2]|uniref:single-stranded DNA-binding protein n=1 Tax=Cellulosilyticum sp. WCF-2 TaxID=2497860 RepID=UPI000F8D8990|nr:single-stranded DNA-binding protein [Cellulosilyticum sp. WCF-2]QEH69806.1 single-stranded DNA-binding protein [Cellulosilyticum sp. WCF-2]
MNQVNLMGNVTRDLELKESATHHKYVQFVLAVNPIGSKDRSADFINMVAFGTQAERLSSYVQKGTKLAVSGHLASESYVNKDGAQRTSTNVVIETFELVGKNKSKVKDEAVEA